MADELTYTALVGKISDIDASIAAIVAELGTASAAKHVDYQLGSKRVNASQKLTQLREVRQMYQELLSGMGTEYVVNTQYDVNPNTGEDKTDLVGDEL